MFPASGSFSHLKFTRGPLISLQAAPRPSLFLAPQQKSRCMTQGGARAQSRDRPRPLGLESRDPSPALLQGQEDGSVCPTQRTAVIPLYKMAPNLTHIDFHWPSSSKLAEWAGSRLPAWGEDMGQRLNRLSSCLSMPPCVYIVPKFERKGKVYLYPLWIMFLRLCLRHGAP